MKFEACLLDDEVNPVLSAWLDQNLKPELEQFTALHNHYLGASPQIRCMHGFAVGDAAPIARALYKALKENSGTPFGWRGAPWRPGLQLEEGYRYSWRHRRADEWRALCQRGARKTSAGQETPPPRCERGLSPVGWPGQRSHRHPRAE
jgi:hypothetical protein